MDQKPENQPASNQAFAIEPAEWLFSPLAFSGNIQEQIKEIKAKTYKIDDDVKEKDPVYHEAEQIAAGSDEKIGQIYPELRRAVEMIGVIVETAQHTSDADELAHVVAEDTARRIEEYIDNDYWLIQPEP